MIDRIMIFLFGNFYVTRKILNGLKERGLNPRVKYHLDSIPSYIIHSIRFKAGNEWYMIKFYHQGGWTVELGIGHMIFDWNIDSHCFCIYDLQKMGYKEFLERVDRVIEFFKFIDGSILDGAVHREDSYNKMINSCLNSRETSVEDWIENYILKNMHRLRYLNKSSLSFQESVLKMYPEKINDIKNLDPGLKEKYSHVTLAGKFGMFND